MKRTVLLLMMLALTATGLQPTAAQAASFTPPNGGVFNVPDPFGTRTQNLAIIGKIEAAIQNVKPVAGQPRPQILISTYFLDRKISSASLIAACQRGVSVRVVLDGKIEDAPALNLVKALNADNVPDANRDGVPDGPAKTGPCNSKLTPTPAPTPAPPPTPPPPNSYHVPWDHCPANKAVFHDTGRCDCDPKKVRSTFFPAAPAAPLTPHAPATVVRLRRLQLSQGMGASLPVLALPASLSSLAPMELTLSQTRQWRTSVEGPPKRY